MGVPLSYHAFVWFCSISLLCGYYNLEQEHQKRVHYNQTERQSWTHHRIQNQSVSWAGIVCSLLVPFLLRKIKFQMYLFSYFYVHTLLGSTKEKGEILFNCFVWLSISQALYKWNRCKDFPSLPPSLCSLSLLPAFILPLFPSLPFLLLPLLKNLITKVILVCYKGFKQ